MRNVFVIGKVKHSVGSLYTLRRGMVAAQEQWANAPTFTGGLLSTVPAFYTPAFIRTVWSKE